MAIDLLNYMIWRNGAGGGGASYEKTVGPAPILSISDAKAKPAKSLIVGMEPIQDLHGYDNPWPAGGGKNILPDISRNSSGYNVSVSFNGNTATLTGLANSSGGRNVFRSDYFSLLAGTYYFKTYSNSSVKPSVYLQNDTSIVSADSDGMFTLSADSVKMNIGLNVTSGTDYNYTGTYLISTENVSEYSPYENLCPISGRTGVTVERTGKNLCDHSELVQGITIWGTGEIANVANRVTSGFIPVYEGESYIASIGSGKKVVYYHLYDSAKTGIGVNVNRDTVTIPTGVAYIRFVFGNSDDSDITPSDITDAQIELGSASSYEPFVGTLYHEEFPDTVYGCTVDVVTGVLAVTMAMVDLGSLPWIVDTNRPGVFYSYGIRNLIKIYNNKYRSANLVCTQYSLRDDPVPSAANLAKNNNKISSYPSYGNGYVYVVDLSHATDTESDFKTAMSGVMLAYEIATPQTYHLTPTQIQLLKGANTLWSDADTLTLTYLAKKG